MPPPHSHHFKHTNPSAIVSVGTPPQIQTVILDTGSSDLYFDARSASACTEPRTDSNSCRGGTFDSSSSSTYKTTITGGFNTSFGDGSTATGDFGTDVVQIGDVSLQNVQFGVARDVDSTTGFAIGLMGLGYSFNEASENIYPNMPEVLVDAGAINSRLYSVFLNDVGDATGTILFGGVDTSKYTGDLTTLDLIPQGIETTDGETVNYVYEFVVAVTALSTTANGKTTSVFSSGDASGQSYQNTLPVLLDTGSAAWTVPSSIYADVAALIPNLDDYGNCPCASADADISLTLTFGAAVPITVPVRDLVVPVYDAQTNVQNQTTNGEPLCTFMLSPGQENEDQPFLTLGDAVLRSMYVVFDLDNGQVSLAQAAVNTSTSASTSAAGSSVKIVPKGPGGLAKALGSSAVKSAAGNSYSIAPMVSTTANFALSTVGTAVGTATGTAAIPTEAAVSGTVGSGSGGNGGTATTAGASASSSKKGAAAAVRVPVFEGAGIVLGLVVLGGMGLGGALAI